jgi:hypothetical protein
MVSAKKWPDIEILFDSISKQKTDG